MRTEEKIVRIDEIFVDESLYPRMRWDEETSDKYARAMKNGADFPPVHLAPFSTGRTSKYKWVLIDGRHRMEARKHNSEDHIKAVIHRGLNQQQLLILSVELNVKHGKPLEEEDKKRAVEFLIAKKVMPETISKLMSIPLSELRSSSVKKVSMKPIGRSASIGGRFETPVGDATLFEPMEEETSETPAVVEDAEEVLEDEDEVVEEPNESFSMVLYRINRDADNLLSDLQEPNFPDNADIKNKLSKIKLMIEEILNG